MCEDPNPNNPNFFKSGDELPSVPAIDPFAFTPNPDLRGVWHKPGQEQITIEKPEDLVEYGIRVSEHAVLATPTWGQEELVRYQRAVRETETVLFDLSNQIEG